MKGRYTCCVPGCYNNNKKNKDLHFYRFPQGKSQEKQQLRKKWIHLISRKYFTPGPHHRVCSAHFPGGLKTYDNNIPTIVPKKIRPTVSKPRPSIRARKREVSIPDTENSQVHQIAAESSLEVMTESDLEENSINSIFDENEHVDCDKKKIEELNLQHKSYKTN